jgi:pilus assembly protein Flp/PilA
MTAHMLARLQDFARSETGATSIEYGLVAAGISLAVIAAMTGLGTKLSTKFSSLATQLKK